MKKTFKTILIVSLFVIPVLLMFSGFSEQPDKKKYKVVSTNKQIQQIKVLKQEIKQKRVTIKSVSDYEGFSVLGKMPDIYSNLSIDGELKTDENGSLIVSDEIRLMFDFFLSARQSEGFELCSDRISEYINLTLDGKAAETAHEIFSTYKRYLTKIENTESGLSENLELEHPEKALDTLKKALINRVDLSVALFGEEIANSLFGDSHETALYNISKIEIAQNPERSDKELLIAEEEFHLPPFQKIRVKREQREKSFANEISTLKQKGAIETIYTLRTETFGEDAAKKLSALDKKNSNLNNRIEQFLIQKQNLLNDTDLGTVEIEKRITEIRKNSFEEWELSSLQKAEASNNRQS